VPSASRPPFHTVAETHQTVHTAILSQTILCHVTMFSKSMEPTCTSLNFHFSKQSCKGLGLLAQLWTTHWHVVQLCIQKPGIYVQ
jgi:hypothetical protein